MSRTIEIDFPHASCVSHKGSRPPTVISALTGKPHLQATVESVAPSPPATIVPPTTRRKNKRKATMRPVTLILPVDVAAGGPLVGEPLSGGTIQGPRTAALDPEKAVEVEPVEREVGRDGKS